MVMKVIHYFSVFVVFLVIFYREKRLWMVKNIYFLGFYTSHSRLPNMAAGAPLKNAQFWLP